LLLTDPHNPKLPDAVDQLLEEAEALGDLEGAMPLYERALALGLVGTARRERLLRFECALAGSAVH
jgi:hypothetical protein